MSCLLDSYNKTLSIFADMNVWVGRWSGRKDIKPTQLLEFLQKRHNFPSEIVILVNETICKTLEKLFLSFQCIIRKIHTVL